MAAIDAKPSRELFVHDHRARLKAEPGCIQERGNAARHHRRGGNEKETIEGISLANDARGPRDRRLHELNLAAENNRDELTDDDAETPGRQNGIKGPIVQRTYNQG